MDKYVVDALNDFLEGNYMAIHIYDKYIQRVDDDRIKQTLQQIQKNHKRHAEKISERIQNLGGLPVHDVGLKGSVTEWIGTIKGAVSNELSSILKDALIGEKRGIEKSKKLLEDKLDQESLSIVKDILAEDETHIEIIENLINDDSVQS